MVACHFCQVYMPVFYMCCHLHYFSLGEENNNMGKTEDALRALECLTQKQNACACKYQAHVCHGNVAHHRRPPIGHYATWFLGKGEGPGVVFSTVLIPPNVLMIRKCITK